MADKHKYATVKDCREGIELPAPSDADAQTLIKSCISAAKGDHNPNPGIVTSYLRLAARLCESPEDAATAKSGLIAAAISLISSRPRLDEDILVAALDFLIVACECFSLRVVREGVLPIISSILGNHVDESPLVVAHTLRLLSKLALYDIADTLRIVFDCLAHYSEPHILLVSGLQVLTEACPYSKYHSYILTEGIQTQAVAHALRALQKTPDALCSGLETVLALSDLKEHALPVELVLCVKDAIGASLSCTAVQEAALRIAQRLSQAVKSVLNHKDEPAASAMLALLAGKEMASALVTSVQSSGTETSYVLFAHTLTNLMFYKEKNTPGDKEVALNANAAGAAAQLLVGAEGDNGNVQLACLEALSAICFHSEAVAESICINRGAVDVVLRTMKTSTDARVQESCCTVIHTLAFHKSSRDCVLRARGVVAEIAAVLRANISSLSAVRNATRALSLVLTSDTNAARDVVEGGGVELLLEALRLNVPPAVEERAKGDSRSVLHILMCLRNISLKEDSEFAVKLARAGVLPETARAMKTYCDKESFQILILGCRLTTNLCKSACDDVLPLRGAIEGVLGALALFASEEGGKAYELQTEAMRALASLAFRATKGRTVGAECPFSCLRDCGVPERVISIMASYHPSPTQTDLVQECLNSLIHMSNGELLVGRIIEVEGISAVAKIMAAYTDNVKIQISCCGSLAPLAFRHEDTANRIAAANVIPNIFKAMSTHKSVKLHESCLLLLANMFWHPQITCNSKEWAEYGISCIVQSMKANAQHHSIQKAACRVLSHLAHNSSEHKRIIAASGGIDAILRSMCVHNERARNLYHACAALKNLAWKSDEMTSEIVSRGGVEEVANVINNSETNQVLRELAKEVHRFLLMKADGTAVVATPTKRPSGETPTQSPNRPAPLDEDDVFTTTFSTTVMSPSKQDGDEFDYIPTPIRRPHTKPATTEFLSAARARAAGAGAGVTTPSSATASATPSSSSFGANGQGKRHLPAPSPLTNHSPKTRHSPRQAGPSPASSSQSKIRSPRTSDAIAPSTPSQGGINLAQVKSMLECGKPQTLRFKAETGSESPQGSSTAARAFTPEASSQFGFAVPPGAWPPVFGIPNAMLNTAIQPIFVPVYPTSTAPNSYTFEKHMQHSNPLVMKKE